MSIDLKAALGAELPRQRFSWTPNDIQTYHLALGAGSSPLDNRELRYLDDAKPQVLPTFATVAATFHSTEAPRVRFPGIDIDLAKVVHGSQEIETYAPVPASGEAETVTRITEIWDKGQCCRHRAGNDHHGSRRHRTLASTIVDLRTRRRWIRWRARPVHQGGPTGPGRGRRSAHSDPAATGVDVPHVR